MKTIRFAAMTCCLLIVTSLLTAGDAKARTLEEILKDKGVITAEDYAEAMKTDEAKTRSEFNYVPGKGLSAATADGTYKMQIGGWGQLIYKHTAFERNGTSDKSGFDIRRFKLVLSGNAYSKKLTYKYQGDISSGYRTEDVFLTYKFGTPFAVTVGQFKPAQARQELTSAARQLFPERSLANDTFNLGRDQGVQAAGSFAKKRVEYRLGIANGNGPNTSNPDNRHMFTGRFDINPLGAYKMDEAGWPSDKPLVNIGASYAWNKIGPNDVGSGFSTDNTVMGRALGLGSYTKGSFAAAYGNDLVWQLWTANLNATWIGATFAAEYYELNTDPQIGSEWDSYGSYVQAGYQVLPKQLELGVRYSEVKSTDVNASAKFDKSETQVGANYYWNKHNLKAQADYTWVRDDLNINKNDKVARVQLQFYF